ncbi:hypothetical protein TTHERM_01216070 (macronuclear) [Tetrahymena thermophila SB210]|uniref:Uncharacterized protein n=1 Tax=Tetrahymena thermophila (strain SB210) TaxID=312017 RepID=Q22VA6_TETTS|nr:hypothetical protein TTHERM_01216070 [Tetrahymena thermophila SB210]EAR89213.1 hypothetical protein TTHERM_01216070 [Tetrahymena thermophila SB210]|eukprot:XP_001009458.1 hypothetical protein TTHERM_01216070 [Tetrahymena thermophila SB210]
MKKGQKNLYFKDNEEKQLIFENKKGISTKKEQRVCQLTPLVKMPSLERIFFIYGDILINLNENKEQVFFDQLKLQSALRPILNIKKENESLFMRVEFNNEQQGQIDFRPIINIMQTMQNDQMYQLSQTLSQYQLQILKQIQFPNTIDHSVLRQKKEVLRYFKDSIIPQILIQQYQENSTEVQAYGLFECLDSMYDSRISEYGFNQNYLHLIGTDFETIQQFYLREGWFSVFYSYSNDVVKKHLEKVIEYFYFQLNNACKQENQQEYQMNINFSTLDQIEISAQFKEKTYFVYQNSQYLFTDYVVPENVHNIIGLFGIMTIDVNPQQIMKLMQMRQDSQQFNQNNLLSQYGELSLSQFQYEIQSKFFKDKYYQDNLSSTCKVKYIG